MRRGLLHEGQSSSAIFHTIRIMTGPVSVAMLKEKPGTVQVAMLKEKPGMVQVAALKYDLSYSILSTTTVPFYQEPSTEVLKSQIERYKPSSYPPPPLFSIIEKIQESSEWTSGGGGGQNELRETHFFVWTLGWEARERQPGKGSQTYDEGHFISYTYRTEEAVIATSWQTE